MPARKPPTNTYWTIRHNWNGELWPRLWPSEETAWKALAKETGFTKAEVAAKCNWSMVEVKVSVLAEVVPDVDTARISSTVTADFIPAELARFGGIFDAVTHALPAAVYFLYLKGALQYIGQSTDPSGRLAQHRKMGKMFDRVFCLPVPNFMLARVEGALIRLLKPPMNTATGSRGEYEDEETLAWISMAEPLVEV
jgi:hypothetical protein